MADSIQLRGVEPIAPAAMARATRDADLYDYFCAEQLQRESAAAHRAERINRVVGIACVVLALVVIAYFLAQLARAM